MSTKTDTWEEVTEKDLQPGDLVRRSTLKIVDGIWNDLGTLDAASSLSPVLTLTVYTRQVKGA